MTTVVFSKNKNNEYTGFVCFGHAEYAKKHKPDILCSAISALVIGTINSLEELAGEDLEIATNEETGFIKCDFNSTLQEKSVFLVDSLVFSLQNLSKQYGEKFLIVNFKEV